MKRHIGAALFLSAVMALTGCSGSGNVAETTTQPGSEEAPQTSTATETTVAEETSEEGAVTHVMRKDITAKEFVSDMKIGWNLGNTLDSETTGIDITAPAYDFETAWGAQYTSQVQMDTVIDAGFNVIRIPVSWANHIHDDGNYTIEPSWMDRVEEVVNMAYSKGAYVILNTHHENWCYTYTDNEAHAKEELAAVWTQIAERFKDYGDHLIFEGLNEPRKVGAGSEWYGDSESRRMINEMEQIFVDTVRKSGGNNEYRFLMVTGYAASSSRENLAAIVVPDDERLIVSVHAYIPYNFALDTNGTATWNNATGDIDTLMANIKELFLDKGIPVIIGEFGAVAKDNTDERVAWATYYVNAAKAIGVPCVWWDNHSFGGNGEGLGLLKCQGLNIKWKFPEIKDALINAAYAK